MSESRRILHIDTERTWRGGQQQAFSLIEGLKARGHHNTAVVYKGSPLAEKLKGVCEVMEVRPLGEWDVITAHFVNRRIKAASIDVVHAHSGHGVALAAISVLGTQVPYVLTRRVDFRVGRHFFSRWKYKHAAAVAAISNMVKEVLIASGIEEKKIFLIPSGVDFNKYVDVTPVPRDRFGFPGDAIIIGQVAALAPHKDQKTFLGAITALKRNEPRVRAVIVGEGPCRDEIEKEIVLQGLSSTVKLMGYQNRPLDYLASFDIFCLSSKEEGLGTSIIDAMALQKPVVATSAGGIPDLIEDGKTGYLAPPEDPGGLSGALQNCLFDKNKPEILARATEKAKKFDVSFTVQGTEALYEAVLKNRK